MKPPHNEHYAKGDDVIISLPSGNHRGTIIEILPGYGWGAECKYRVKCKEFEKITSARTMRKNGRLF